MVGGRGLLNKIMFMWGGSALRSNPLPFIYHFSCRKATLSHTVPPPGKCYDHCTIQWVKIYASDGWNYPLFEQKGPDGELFIPFN